MIKVLIGTTNPSKVGRFEELLKGTEASICTLQDLQIDVHPDETGKTPEENAAIKARFYGQFSDLVICNDSGLYFEGLPLDDSRQPGLNVRTPGGGKRLNDEEMILWYTNLVHSLGGMCAAYYLDGIAVYNHGKVYSYMENPDEARHSSFYMTDRVSDKRHEGWPLDAMSLNRTTMTYFVDEGNRKYDMVEEVLHPGESRSQLAAFLKESLGLKQPSFMTESGSF